MTITAPDFEFVRSLVQRKAAIVLEGSKAYLAENRLTTLAQSEGIPTLGDLMARLRRPDPGLEQKVVEAMTTNETYFFRDIHPFEMLRLTVLPRLIAARRADRRLTIWSAACSTGQEAYSTAMLIREHFPELDRWDVRIIGTDLATTVVAKARAGRYSQLEVNRGLPIRLLAKYFTKTGETWEVKPEIRAMTDFRPMNLVGPWAGLPTFDVVFIRNVLIYFDLPTKRAILANAKRAIRPDGVLLLGGSETTMGLGDDWERVETPPSYYYRPR